MLLDNQEIRVKADKVLKQVNDLFEQFEKETGHILVAKQIDAKMFGAPTHTAIYILDDIVLDLREKK